MDCVKCQNLLNAYLDGELEGEQFIALENHLGQCPSCKAELNRLVKMRGLLKDLRDVEVPEGEKEAFIDALRDRLSAEGAHHDAVRPRDYRPWLAAAIVVVMVLIAIVAIPGRKPPEQLIKPAPGFNAIENAAFDRMVFGGLGDHFITTSSDFMSDPAVTGGQVVAVWKVFRSSHGDLFGPVE